jgi:hypothetical protein
MVSNQSKTTEAMPVLNSTLLDADKIVLSGTSQQSDFTVPADQANGMFWRITAIGGNLRILFGANPTAVADEGGGWVILSGTTDYFAAVAGDKAAVISAETFS